MRVAVQEELAHVICSMPGIERAAVLYDVTDRGSLDGGLASGPVRTASVNVRTLPDVELEPTRVQAIRVLVAASIAGLDAERVAVTDLRSGRVHAGPLAAPADDTETLVDRDLARRVAHEKHLAAKVRQALGFVKGATVDVSVTFADVATVDPRATASPPEPQLPQRDAAANTPARVGGDSAAVVDDAMAAHAAAATVVRGSSPAGREGPETIVVSIAVPDSYVAAAVRAARDREPGVDPVTAEAGERQRLTEHVRSLLPATPRPEGHHVAITVFPDLRGRDLRTPTGNAAAGTVPPPHAEPSRAFRAVVATATAAWDAARGGDFAAVPREAWLVTGAGIGLLVVLVLARRPPADFDARESRPRRRQPRDDWSEVDRGPRADDDRTDTAPRVAA